MNQKEKISNSFSDSYLAALLEGMDTSAVLRKYSDDFPELASAFEANAKSLDLLYGDLRSAEMPSEKEIAQAYQKVSGRFAPVTAPVAVAKPGFFTQLTGFFSASPTRAGASLAIGAAVIIALLWQPWMIKESGKETAESSKSVEHVAENSTKPNELASNDQGQTNQLTSPEGQLRGSTPLQNLTPAQRKLQDSLDAIRLKQLSTPKPLAIPGNITIQPLSAGSILVRWDAVPDALSYIIEIRGANDAKFKPVTQVSQTNLRVPALESGKTYFVRVTATSGERKGLPSDAKSIVVP